MKNYIIIGISLLFLANSAIYGQDEDGIDKVKDLLENYLAASTFEEDSTLVLNEKTKKAFTRLFKKNAEIIFDVPLRDESESRQEMKRYGGTEGSLISVIPVYGKMVSPEKYVSILEKELRSNRKIRIRVNKTGKESMEGFESAGIVIFEIEKFFVEKDTLTTVPVNYLVEIDASGPKPLIANIRLNDDNIQKRNVIIHLFNDSRQVTTGDVFICTVKTEFQEHINNSVDTIETKDGKIRLDNMANRATIKIVSAYDRKAVAYEIPGDWKQNGKKVSEQPEDGFEINLLPKVWKGWAYTIDMHGGVVLQDESNMVNFEDGSVFIHDPGYRLGMEVLVTKYFNPIRWRQSRRLFGIGIGVTINYQAIVSKSNYFIQNTYTWEDNVSHTAEVRFSSNQFKEATTRLDIGIPIFIDFKTRLGAKTSMTIKPGVNVIVPFQIDHSAEGIFSRWGTYEFNDAPITDDPDYNYFNAQPRNYTDDGVYSLQLEGQLRINFLLNVFKKNKENSLIIGLIGSLPIMSPSYNYGKGLEEDGQGDWVNTENEEYYISTENEIYHSITKSKSKPYNFFIGLSVGINLVKYKTK